ncbi:hypothetical protein SLITO_v1c09410 [Spiroplasma litorale]|uniref:Lipoprotein n=1 Tax=Spiroplasma litorale TaxID=216942 RepID=A0A0K1W369_9MOLU|nr:hypothetical protein [Spiroplasma litorale]AKX34552.1 hypothetical protein SLITO_v1c09410 [Spiroplasma litorale]
MKKILHFTLAITMAVLPNASIIGCSNNKKEDKVIDLNDVDFSSLTLEAGKEWSELKRNIKSKLYNIVNYDLKFGEDWFIDNFNNLVDKNNILKNNLPFKGSSKELKTKYYDVSQSNPEESYSYVCGFNIDFYLKFIIARFVPYTLYNDLSL